MRVKHGEVYFHVIIWLYKYDGYNYGYIHPMDPTSILSFG